MSRLAEGESNDVDRQRMLRDRAESVAVAWSANDSILAIWLSGSAARGPVGRASDLDLHVISVSPVGTDVPLWRFGSGDVIENAHVVLIEELNQGFARIADSLPLAEWFYRTTFGDELQGGACVYTRQGCAWVNDRVRQLTSRRLERDVIEALTRRHADGAKQLAASAERDLAAGSAYDSQQKLRYASQSLLTAAMIRCGWIIRGSKKRPEISSAYSDDLGVRTALAILEEIVGIADLTLAEAIRVCAARLECRGLLLQELRRMYTSHEFNEVIRQRLGEELELQAVHNALAVDYYEPLVSAGFLRGPVNHIRALSGFSRLPSRVLRCLGRDDTMPVETWTRHETTSVKLREAWLEVAAFSSSSTTISEWTKQIRAATERLR